MSSSLVFNKVYRLEIRTLSYSQSCWYFRPIFMNYCPSNLSGSPRLLYENMGSELQNRYVQPCAIFIYLKGVWHEIFDFKFFSWISVPQAPKYSIGAFLNFFENSWRYSKLMFITGVNDTGDKMFSGVSDTGKKFIAGVVDTGEQFIFPRCRWYRSEKNQKA